MLAIYDKVMTSSSESTLIILSLGAVFLFVVMGSLEWIRSQILIAISTRLDLMLGGRVFNSIFQLKINSTQPLLDLTQLRQFLTGSGLFAFFDAPWLPIYICLLFAFHWSFGVVAIIASIILVALTYWNETVTKKELTEATLKSSEANQSVQRNVRNIDAIESMGMLEPICRSWSSKQAEIIRLQNLASSKSSVITSLVKTFRQIIQSLILGLGAYLAIHREISPGLVIAGSILLSRALAPLDLMISNWKNFSLARDSYVRLSKLLIESQIPEQKMLLPEPIGNLQVEGVTFTPKTTVLNDVSFEILAGQSVAIIGPSAAGKSTLIRTILGLVSPTVGCVRFDGAKFEDWNKDQLKKNIGYLPQDVELLDGSIMENISRFGEIDSEAVVMAAKTAGIHEMILKLPNAYDTKIGSNGAILSAGQKQRIGIARAVYKTPKYVIMDEPNANLDQNGDIAFLQTLLKLKELGSTVIVITHRNNVLSVVDNILLMVDGSVAAYGPTQDVLSRMQQSGN
jgi:ATP-binding cassette subfamily C protein EexD